MTFIDGAIVVAYFVILLLVGFFTREKKGVDESSTDFITASRSMPWPAVLMSIIATEISAITFLGTPSAGFSSDMNYLQFGIGSIVGRILIATLFIGVFYKYNCVTIYDYLAKRFGESTRYSATIFFFITRILASGVRLMVAATAVAVIMEWPIGNSILIFTTIAMIYTSLGGIKAVIWTDVVQGTVFLLGGLAVLVFLITQIDGGFSELWRMGGDSGRLNVFRFTPTQPEGKSALWAFFNDGTFFLIAFINGMVTTFAALGTDQDLSQRMLTCKNAKESKFSLILSGILDIPIVFGFLLIGVALWVFYQQNPDPNMPMIIKDGLSVVDHDKVFSYFIRTGLPDGLRGLLFVGALAAAMSSLDSALAALSSSAVIDIYKPLIGPNASEKKLVWLSRVNILGFGIVLAAVAYMMKDAQDILWLPFKIGGITYGSLLGVFLLGVLTKNGSNKANLIGMISSAVTLAVALVLIEKGVLEFAWSWLIVIGTAWTFIVGYIGGRGKPGPVMSVHES